MNAISRLSMFSLLAALVLALPHPRAGLASTEHESSPEVPPENRIQVQLGSKDNAMRFFPGRIVMRTGQVYELTLTNPSPVTHEFASERLSGFIVTEHMKFFDGEDRLVGYVRGTIAEVELLPGGRIEWLFTAARAGETIDLFCDIPGHLDAGMVGGIQINP